MPKTVVMPVTGILRNPIGGQLNHDGYFFFRGLCDNFNVVLTTFDTQDKFKAWAAMENIIGQSNVLYPDFRMNITDGYWTNVSYYLRRHGYDIAFFVVTDPRDATELLMISEASMLYVQPAYAMSEWLPDSEKGKPAWSDLVDRVLMDKAARAKDTRTDIKL
jgi:hypothetical protein